MSFQPNSGLDSPWAFIDRQQGACPAWKKEAKLANEQRREVTTMGCDDVQVSATFYMNDSISSSSSNIDTKHQERKDSYKRQWGLTFTHNGLVSLFARAKAAILSQHLTNEEVLQLRAEAVGEGRTQVKALYWENEKSEELNAIVSPAKKARKQGKIFAEVRKQLSIWGNNLGLEGFGSPEYMLTTKIDACNEIRAGFAEELRTEQYKLDSGSTFAEGEEKETPEEIQAKIARINGYITKIDSRIQLHTRALENLKAKEAKKVGSANPVIKGKIYG